MQTRRGPDGLASSACDDVVVLIADSSTADD